MHALAEGVEVRHAVGVEEHDLAVEHVAAGREAQLGEVAQQRAAVARLEVEVAVVDEGDGAEAVPLGFIAPVAARRQRLRGAGELRGDGRLEGKGDGWMLRKRPSLIEPGPVLGTELREDDRRQRQQESESEHASSVGRSAALLQA